MDWDKVATLSQLITGVATLAVAALLVSQLRQQHKDAEREILYTANRDITNLFCQTIDPHFGPIWDQGSKDFDALEGDEQRQFRILCYSLMMTQAVNFRAGHEGLDRGIDSRLEAQTKGMWTMNPGMATYYERYGRTITFDPEMRGVLDSVFIEVNGREVDTNYQFGETTNT